MYQGSPLRRALGALLIAASLGLAPAARADTTANEALIGVGSAFTSLIYAPAKLVYAGGGAIVAGLAWLLSAGDADVMYPILTAAVRGDYVVTPSHLRGEQPLEFIGRSSEQERARDDARDDLGGEVVSEEPGF